MVNVFIDTDMGWDDWCAITLLAQSKSINIIGVSVNGVGEANLSYAVQNALDLLSLNGINNLVVGCGAGSPVSYSNVFPAEFRHTMNQMMNYELPKVARTSNNVAPANVVLNQALLAQPDLTLLAIGGFTNLYNYLADNDVNGLVPKKVVTMAGAIEVAGNINSFFPAAYPNNNTAEWNVFIDPLAASKVLDYYQQNKLEIELSPLDASYHVKLTTEVVEQIVNAEVKTPVNQFIGYVLNTRFQQAKKEGYAEYFYDPLAAACVIDPDLATYSFGDFSVCTELDEEQSQLGKLSFSQNTKSTARYANNISSPNAFYSLFTESILSS